MMIQPGWISEPAEDTESVCESDYSTKSSGIGSLTSAGQTTSTSTASHFWKPLDPPKEIIGESMPLLGAPAPMWKVCVVRRQFKEYRAECSENLIYLVQHSK